MSLRHVRLLLLALIALEVALLIWGPHAADHLPAIQASLAAKQKPEWWDNAAMGIRYAAWINLGLFSLFLITSQWWTRPVEKSRVQNPEFRIQTPRWFWPLLIVAMLLCLGLRLPLASKSLWWDESWVMFQVVHGKWRPDSKHPGQLKFQSHDWKRCAFYYQKPTNHAPMSLAQKASLAAWHKLTGAAPGDFSELAVRTPALLASCAAVLMLALLLRSWGWPRAGLAAAFVLALHPWHVRYGVDARGYALVVPLCIAAMFAVSRIWQSRGAAFLPWLCWGVIEFFWLWAYPNAVLDVAALNLLLLTVFLRETEFRTCGILRLLATNLFAAIALIQVFLPNFMQAIQWAGSENVAQPLSMELVKSTLSQLFLGVELAWPPTIEAKGLVSSGAGTSGTSFAGSMITLAASVAVLLFLRRRATHKLSPRHWLVLGMPAASSLAFAIFVGVTGSYFYPRFVIAMLPSVIALLVALFAEALEDTTSTAHRSGWRLRTRRSVALLLLVFLILKIAPFWVAQTQVQMSRPYAPLREATRTARAIAKDSGGLRGPGLIVCYGHGHEVLPLYLPEIQPALSRAELEQFVTQARVAQRPLIVIQGHTTHNRASIPDGFALLDDSSVFEELKAFPGIDPEFYTRIYRLK